jgi:tetratricopeptide (TPR) repeat protein
MSACILSGIFTLILIVFLPFTQDYYTFNKWILLIVLSLVTTGVWISTSLKKSTFQINWSTSALGLWAITVVSFLSLAIASVNRVEALLDPFGPVTFLTLAIIITLLPPLFDIASRKKLLWFLYGSGALLGLITVYQFFGMGKMMFPTVTYLLDPLWTPTGSTVATISLCILILPLLVSHIIQSWKAKSETQAGILALIVLIVTSAIVLSAVQLIPKISSSFLPLREGWMIMLEILKTPKQAIFGVGAENFLAAFAAGRPLTMNLTPIWNLRFTTNATLFFHLVTLYGLLGAVSCILFAKSFLQKPKNTFTISLTLGLISLFLIPPNICILVVLTILLVLSHNPKQIKEFKVHSRLWQKAVLVVAFGASVLAITVLLAQIYMSESKFYLSLIRAKENNGTATYNLQIDAIKKNPDISRFHISFSQTNLALATSLAGTITNTDQLGDQAKADQAKDRGLIAQLIEQSIWEAKIAVNLNQYDILAWENLANTYQQIIGVAQGAEDWTIASYTEAVRRDPTNPTLPFELGIIYARLNQYPDAIRLFQQSILKKPNYVNAYYNLSNTYKLNKDTTQAVSAMEQALSYTKQNTEDYTIISKELDNLRKNVLPAVVTPTVTPFIAPPLTFPTGTGPNTSEKP